MRKFLLAAVTAATTLLAACSGGSTATSTSSFVPAATASPSQTAGPEALAAPVSGSPITHVIVVIQENRTLDNLFGQSVYNQTGATTFGPYPNANAADTWSVAGSPQVAMSQVPFEYPYDPSHVFDALYSEFLSQQTGTNLGFYLDASTPAEAGLPGRERIRSTGDATRRRVRSCRSSQTVPTRPRAQS
jgi:hypothetical protein